VQGLTLPLVVRRAGLALRSGVRDHSTS